MPNKSRLKCYFGCANDGPLHHFPNPKSTKLEDIEKFSRWKAVLDKITQEKGNVYIYNHILLCNKHFLEGYQLPSRRLTKNAVPTLNLGRQTPPIIDQSMPSTSGLQLLKVQQIDQNMQPSTLTAIQVPRGHQQPSDAESVALQTSTIYKPTMSLRKQQNNIKIINKLKMKLEKMALKYKNQKRQIQAAKKMSMNTAFLSAIEKLPESIKTFTKLQLKSQIKPRGRRFTNEEKVMALTILKQSPKAYELLKKMFVLPSKRCLQGLLHSFRMEPGINKEILEDLKKVASRMSTENKLVNILFDEVSLAPGVEYNAAIGKIIGFEDYGYTRNKTLADHALVFMIKGIKSKCKQPICFTFCKGTTKAAELKNLLKCIIKEINATGLIVVATICDQATTNVRVVRELQNDTRERYVRQGNSYNSQAFEINGKKIFPLFDTPHLLKGVRNNLLSKNAKFVQNGEVKWAKWEHLKMLLAVDDGDDEIRLVNKLTEMHVDKNKIPKMKVKFAAQVFSQRVSSALRFLSKHNILPDECQGTADFLLVFDKLFDSFNGHSYEGSPKKYKQCLKYNSPHFQLWNEMLPILESIKFESVVRKNDSVLIKHESIPSIKNWIHNIKTFKEMWLHVNVDYKIKNLLTRNFNQDPLENFFSSIRSNGVRNINPNCNQFMNAYKTLLINNFNSVHSVRANCEDDFNKSFQSFFNLIANKPDLPDNDDFACDIDALLMVMNEIKINDSLIYKESKKYVAGYIIKKIKTNVFRTCKTCMRDLCRSEVDVQSFNYEVDYTKKSLFHPSDNFHNLMADIYHLIVACLRDCPESNVLYKKIKFMINCACDYNIITCIKHKELLIECINNLAIKLIIHSWCTGVNRILKGKIMTFDKNDHVKQQAYDYFKKKPIKN
ncbi:uncharacterized protein LOC126912240 isoform X6 [Spodoptera frugiperda]|uniref:Uncharacterized protein LOC126912240 isoform X2 n=1 Tax=Spodoptera frugiperda TaxID=7108 RepID=A0A9R0E5M3_SPOFR|nr:uncharacterized protein LOC126912240 isoform X2 [Spodoptera frugiperda]XP_050559420.1 uncharacterized protein LOC126912240 isoform X3 [Spodoptera frugiperda]XP_050559421.1 uncharacterized protein LOC126912240 isoform X4 [Spodoptera frugiperda]XP_050559422.1 uncharacterized protein LOC126912240 isoform X5 [Spodoptera frugiperda]XP_050559423.1 uncharacterized protein LOC126912240 isoform X6 [Spodoptera frugiperda]